MIYVITHKKFNDSFLDKNDYIVLHVGLNDNCEDWYLRDDEGDNISFKNPNFCELTGLYWMWKHSKESEEEIIGLTHYRRFFTDKKSEKEYRHGGKMPTPLSVNSISQILNSKDIILPTKKHAHRKVKETYVYFHSQNDYDIMRKSIRTIYPDYLDAFEKMMNSHDYYYANMFITTKNILNNYAEWLFNLMSEIEKHVDLDSYTDEYQKRVYGFMSERLLQVWVEHNDLKTFECPVFNTEDRGETIISRNIERIKRYLGHK